MNDCLKEVRKHKNSKRLLTISKVFLLIAIFVIWEACARLKIIDVFLFSSPSRIWKTLITYINNGEIYKHIYISMLEVILGMIIGSILGIMIASILWYNKTLQKLLDPFLMVLNALPKTALAPIMIIWAGTGVRGIVVVALSILLIITIISAYNHMQNVDKEKIAMMESFKASKSQIYCKLILPSNLTNIISIIKINIGMAWIGVIVGEFLVSRAGIGYLIMYGGQVFNMDLVMMGVFVLGILAFIMWKAVDVLEKYLINKRKEE